MLRNWRICPLSSRTWRERPGNCLVRASSASATVAAVQSTFGAPSVKRRNAVGISIVTGICFRLLAFKYEYLTHIDANCHSERSEESAFCAASHYAFAAAAPSCASRYASNASSRGAMASLEGNSAAIASAVFTPDPLIQTTVG